MQDERVNVWAKLSDYEGDAVCHQAADEVNITAEAVQFGDRHGAVLSPRLTQGRCKLRAPVESVRPLARLDLNEHPAQREALSARKAL